MINFAFKELLKEFSKLRGREILKILADYIGSFYEAKKYSDSCAEEVLRKLDELECEMKQKSVVAFPIERYTEKENAVRLNVHNMIRYLHPMRDYLLQIINLTILDQQALAPKDVKYKTIKENLKKINGASTVIGSLNKLHRSQEFRYISKYSNISKHQRIPQSKFFFHVNFINSKGANKEKSSGLGADISCHKDVLYHDVVSRYRLEIYKWGNKVSP